MPQTKKRDRYLEGIERCVGRFPSSLLSHFIVVASVRRRACGASCECFLSRPSTQLRAPTACPSRLLAGAAMHTAPVACHHSPWRAGIA
jgi:hypothetical protein